MIIRKAVASAGREPAPTPIMEVEEVEEVDGAVTEAKTPSHNRRLEEVNWKWRRQSLQGHHVTRIRLYYRKAVFEDISFILTGVGGKELLQQFVDGCFGHLMHLTGLSICTEALHELISREIVLSGAPENELWFRVGVTNIRFSPQEYALVTGLHFGSSSFDPHESHGMPEDGICKRFFENESSISVQQLWNKFNSKDLGRSGEVYLKVAHILALYLAVLGYGQTKVVDEWVWLLAENLDLWKVFPWGAYTYQALVHYVRLLPNSTKDAGQAYNFPGPAWVLQLWGYEAIPLLGSTCATITGKATVPRCRNWLSRNRKIKTDLADFLKTELVCLEKLHPTDEEKEEPYWLSVQCTQPLGVRYTHPQRFARAEGIVRPPLAFDPNVLSEQPRSASAENADPIEDRASDDSTWSPSPRLKRKRGPRRSYVDKDDTEPRCVPQGFDEAHFLNQVSDTMVDRLIEPVLERLSLQLIPRMKQLIESGQSPSKQNPPQTSREVHDQLEVVLDSPFLRVDDPPVNCEDSAKAAERKMEKQSNDGGSSSMNFASKVDNGHCPRDKTEPAPKEVLNNAPRLDTGVSAVEKSSVKGEDAIDQIHEKQIGSSERLKGELKRKSGTSPHREGDEANTAKKKKKSQTEKKKSRRPPSSSEDESSSGDERRRQKKRSKKRRRKHHKSSSSESSTDSDRRRRKRNRHKSRRRSASPEASDSGSG